MDETLALIISSNFPNSDSTRNQYLIQVEIEKEIFQKLNTSDYESELDTSIESLLWNIYENFNTCVSFCRLGVNYYSNKIIKMRFLFLTIILGILAEENEPRPYRNCAAKCLRK